jgi:hypothetical protein
MPLRKRTRASLIALMTGTVMVLSVQSAIAVPTNIYDNFTRCPTSSAAMNDPEGEFAACASAKVASGLLEVGNFQAPIASPAQFQFGMTTYQSEPQPESVVVPGSTSLDVAPFLVPNVFYTPSAPPAATPPAAPVTKKAKKAKKNKGKKKGHKKKGKKGKKGKKKGHKKKHKGHKKKHKPSTPATPPSVPPAPPFDPSIKVSVEPIGDVEKLDVLAVLGEEGVLFELSVRLHLEGSGLGPSCYIGSLADPIRLRPVVKGAPESFYLATDPNGFKSEVLQLGGITLEDSEFSVPGARGCGAVDPGTGAGSLDPAINAAIGLPAAPGESKAIFDETFLELGAAPLDGTPPDGGLELEEAFEAAK